MTGWRRVAAIFALATLGAVALAGCGAPSADLFVVERTGTIPGARLSMLVGDGGTVRCNGAAEKDISSAQLIAARKAVRELNGKDEQHPGPAVKLLRLPPGPQSILRYDVRTEKGRVVFSDSSPGQPAVFFRTAQLVRNLAIGVCGLPR